MNYKEYYETYYNYRQAKNKLQKMHNELADTINALLSVSSEIKENPTFSNSSNDKMMNLTLKKVDLEAQIPLATELLKIRENQRKESEQELRKSSDVKDIIYFKYFIDHIKVKNISSQISYAREYTYELLKSIRKDIYEFEKELDKKSKKN